jgi:hypothetical protein
MFPIVLWNLREGNLRVFDIMIIQYFGMLENSVNYLDMHLMRLLQRRKEGEKFIKGLNLYMRMQLRLTRHRNFQGIVDAAITLEDDYKSVQEEQRKKARTEPKRFLDRKPTPNLNFKPRPRPGNPNPNPNRGGPNPKNNVICHNVELRDITSQSADNPKSSAMDVDSLDTDTSQTYL